MVNTRLALAIPIVVLSSGLAAQALAQDLVYSCTNEAGRKLTSDRPIFECSDREQRVLETTTGRVTFIRPKQTEAERWAEEAKKKQVARERDAAIRQQRYDKQLLVRYPDEASLEEKRSYMLDEAKKRWAPTLNEQAEINARRKVLSQEAENRRRTGKAADFSSAKEAAQLERRTFQLQPMVARAEADLDKINAEMDADLARLRELRGQAQTARAVSLGQIPAPSTPPASKTPSP